MPRKREPTRHVLTRDIYAALVDAYREDPGNHTAASRKSGLNWRTARTAWEEGFCKPKGHGALYADWALPIKDVIESEKSEARERLAQRQPMTEEEKAEARLAMAKRNTDGAARAPELADATVRYEDDRERVRAEAMVRRDEWTKAARSVRLAASGVLQAQSNILAVILKRSKEWLPELEREAMTADRALRMIRTIGLSARQVAEALSDAQQIENLAVGSPTEILGLVPASTTTMEQEEAEELLGHAYSVMQRLRRKRGESIEVSEAEMVAQPESEQREAAAAAG